MWKVRVNKCLGGRCSCALHTNFEVTVQSRCFKYLSHHLWSLPSHLRGAAKASIMARLAEPSTSESADSVRRRFLRLNRELARVNSSHSTKISELETKIASLTAENLELRQSLLGLEHSNRRLLSQQCGDMRTKLKRKLEEIGELFDGFEGKCSVAESLLVPRSVEKISPKMAPARMDIVEEETGGEIDPQDMELSEDEVPEAVAHLDEAKPDDRHQLEHLPDEGGESISSLPVMDTTGMSTIRPRRKRRDSMQELDIISLVKLQSTNYKAKLQSQQLRQPHADPEMLQEGEQDIGEIIKGLADVPAIASEPSSIASVTRSTTTEPASSAKLAVRAEAPIETMVQPTVRATNKRRLSAMTTSVPEAAAKHTETETRKRETIAKRDTAPVEVLSEKQQAETTH
ncbi:uncharacterized protein V1518DRAFT_89946 [Limtongia smithiae]|uniref:uncharacterized protein n=1 Tax=Limtongia smithiae TaxID=1125753 RepID=UPI0034CD429F